MSTTNSNTILQNLSQGNKDGEVNYKAIINGRKIENICLKFLVEELRNSGVKDGDIIDMILTLDKGAESGELDEETLLNLNK
jgi:hypothetical protein